MFDFFFFRRDYFAFFFLSGSYCIAHALFFFHPVPWLYAPPFVFIRFFMTDQNERRIMYFPSFFICFIFFFFCFEMAIYLRHACGEMGKCVA